jgi:DNA modification methylase
MSESFLGGRVFLEAGDCRDVLAEMPSSMFHACVTDPPYHLTSIVQRFGGSNAAPVKAYKTGAYGGGFKEANGGTGAAFARMSRGFMGKVWDGGDVAFRPETWAEVLRVLKPGAFLLAFSGTRSYHRMACAIEDAGFEIRDTIEFAHETDMEYRAFESSLNDEQKSQFRKLFRERGAGCLSWNFGSGFPKNRNVTRDISERCMCSVSDCAKVQTAVASRTLLQPEMRWDSQNNRTEGTDLRGLRKGLDSEDPISSGTEQDVRASVSIGLDFKTQQGATVSTRPEGCGAMRGLRENKNEAARVDKEGKEIEGSLLQSFVSCKGGLGADIDSSLSQGSSSLDGRQRGEFSSEDDGGTQSSMEGRSDVSQTQGELRQRSLREMSAISEFDGKSGRLCNGASLGNGADSQASITAGGMRASSRSSAIEQCADQSGTVAMQSQPQERGAGARCGRCGKPIVPDGLGTALKPAMELICLARKPLSEGTVAANVLRWGTGALNIDGCRIPAGTEHMRGLVKYSNGGALAEMRNGGKHDFIATDSPLGRWPANVVHDGSDEVVAAFPESESNGCNRVRQTGNVYGEHKQTPFEGYYDSGSAARFFKTCNGRWPSNLIHDGSDEVIAAFPESGSAISGGRSTGRNFGPGGDVSVKDRDRVGHDDNGGSAARFFASFNGRDGEASAKRIHYTSKADFDDRAGSAHPTVKPLDLIQYLCRLICPKNGTILDPFAGTGTTGEAAFREGFEALLIERDAAYCDDIRRRMALALAGPEERARESVKARGLVLSPGPLFDGLPEAAE